MSTRALLCHPGAGRDPQRITQCTSNKTWMPAYAGMTSKKLQGDGSNIQSGQNAIMRDWLTHLIFSSFDHNKGPHNGIA